VEEEFDRMESQLNLALKEKEEERRQK